MKILSLGLCLGLATLLAGCSESWVKAQSAADVQRIDAQANADVKRIRAQAEADVARKATEAQAEPDEPYVPTVNMIGGYRDAGWRQGHDYGNRDGNRGYDRHGNGGNGRRNILRGEPYVVPLPPPAGGGWQPYYNGPLDNGWVRHNCIANCG